LEEETKEVPEEKPNLVGEGDIEKLKESQEPGKPEEKPKEVTEEPKKVEDEKEPEKKDKVGERDIERLRERKHEEKRDFDFAKIMNLLNNKNGKRLLVLGFVFLIFLLAFWIRSIPAQYNELQALDPFYLYRLTEYAVNNNFQLPEVDTFRQYPYGSIPLNDEFSVPIYLPVTLYTIFGQGMPYLQFAILYPALMGALAIIVMFFIGRELYDYKAGLFSAFFLAVIPAFITRTSAGFFDKEPTFGFFMLVTIYFFIASYKRDSWKYGVLAGIFLGIASISSGIGRYIYIFYFLFAIILLLINKYKGLLASYGPLVIFSTIIQLLAPRGNTDSTLFYIFVGLFGIIVLRYLVEKYKIIKEENLKYFVPGLMVVIVLFLLIGTMFSDYVFSLLNSLVSVVFVLNPSAIGYTVAEQQPGDLNSMIGVSGLGFAPQILPQLNIFYSYFNIAGLPIPGIFSIFLLMVLGIIFIVLRLLKRLLKDKKMSRDDLIFILPLLWAIASMWGVFLFIRLLFLFGMPAALLAGLFVGWSVNKLLGLKHEKVKQVVKYMPFYLTIIIALIVVTNTVNAFAYSSALGPSICITNPQILIDGQRCLDINEDGSITYATGQPWYEAMAFLRDLDSPKSVLTWWDFGHWFHARGETPSASDGGKGPRYETAIWYTASVSEWDDFLPYVRDEYQVTHILQDYTLPGKYGAITAIATNGEGIVGLLQLSQGEVFQEGEVTIQEFRGGQYAIWLPINSAGDIAGSPRLLTYQGEQFVSNGFINDVCSEDGITHVGDETPSIGGCLSFSSFGVYYIPEVAKNTIFISLQFMNGAGLPVKNVFDNSVIKIFEIEYNTTDST